ncbi:MAG: nucleotide exchange factor GrpE [Candidatus Riflebacteria bacterium]|nr:nucleotide exchange factor GrpE [Candidatus Riflebacteria bacterium]
MINKNSKKIFETETDEKNFSNFSNQMDEKFSESERKLQSSSDTTQSPDQSDAQSQNQPETQTQSEFESDTQSETKTEDQLEVEEPDSTANPTNKQEEMIKKLSGEIEEKTKEIQETNNRYRRALADYDNLKKRTEIQVQSAASHGIEHILKRILPVLDSFESALRQMNDSKVEKEVLDGLEMLYVQFTDILEKEGLKPIPARGSKFDPNIHEALNKQSQPEIDDDIVLVEFEKGYFFKEKVLRTAKVSVNQK